MISVYRGVDVEMHWSFKRRAPSAGFDTHLTKPADPSLLEDLIASAARGSSEHSGGDDVIASALFERGGRWLSAAA